MTKPDSCDIANTDIEKQIKIDRWYADPRQFAIRLHSSEFLYLPMYCFATLNDDDGRLLRGSLQTDAEVLEILDQVDFITIYKSPKYVKPVAIGGINENV